MKIYSIVRIGNDYVVRAGEKSILKIASRRRAARLFTDAAELLEPAPPLSPEAHRAINRRDPSIRSRILSGSFLTIPVRFPYAPRRDTSPQREASYLEG